MNNVELFHKRFRDWSITADVFFFLTMIFYFITCFVEPGYVRQEFEIIELLRLANEKSIDLDNFCFYCRVIKSGRTFHCTHCQRCVEKFDHHCTFVNNCLGYKNHKYFLCFIFFYLFYFITSLVASFLSIYAHESSEEHEFLWTRGMDIAFRVIYTVFQFTQFIPLS